MSGGLLLQLTSQDQEKVEAWLVAFDQAWHVGSLAEWTAARLPVPGDPLRSLVLTELVKIDLERQWQAGHRLTLGSYLERYPELGALETVSPELILAEFRVRRQFGVAVDLDDYVRRFPHQAEALAALIERDAASQGRDRSHQPLGTAAERDTSHSEGVSCTVDAAPGPSSHLASDLPETFGRYRVVRKLGQGGMGAVYLAHDTQLDRDVALKIPTFSQREGQEVVDRFMREARAAATIHHPNLCPVYDVGQINGVHFMTMAYIEGRPLSDYIRQGKPVTERQAATVVRSVALALQEAHVRGIVHRDIKPSNIMINTRNEPVIMDFGLARRNDGDEVALTRSGALLGTPAYMAPEQARGLTDAIGPCSDIFSLGVILYELLAGRRPFRGELIEVLSQILTAEPKPPSVHRPGLDPQLEAICLKAMAKRPADRFVSAKEMAAALHVYLRGMHKTAGAAPAVQPSTTAAPAVMSPAATATASPVPSAQAEPSQPAPSLLKAPSVQPAVSHSIASAVAPPRFASATPATSAPAVSLGNPLVAVGKGRRTPGKKRGAPRRNLPPWTWIVAGSAALVLLVSLGVVILLSTPEGTVRIEIDDPQADVQVAVDGRNIDIAGLGEPLRLAVGDHQLVVDGQDIQLHTQSFTIRRGKNPPVRVALIPRSAETPAAPFPASTTPASQPIDRGMVSGQLKHASKVMSLAFSPDGSILAAGDEGGEVRLWDTASGQEIKRLPIGKSVLELAFHPQGRMLAAGGWRRGEAGTVHIWTVPDGQSVKSFSNQAGLRKPMTFSRDGLTLFSSNTEGEIVLWDVDTAAERGRLPGHGAVVTCLATSPDGQLLASGGRDRSVRVWEIATRQQRQSFSYTVNPGDVAADVNFVGFSPDSRHVVFGAKADLIKGDISNGSRVWSGRRHVFSANRGTISPDGQYVLSSGGEGDSDHVVFSALTDGQKSRTLRGYKGAWDVAFHPSGKLLATAGPDNSIKLWDTATWEEVRKPIALEAVRVRELDSPSLGEPRNAGQTKLPPVVEGSSPVPAVFPFDAQQAKMHQTAWARHLGVPAEFENSIGMKFVLIPPGEFRMGSPDDESGRDDMPRDYYHTHGDKGRNNPLPDGDQELQHPVRISQPFYLAATELTQGQWQSIMGTATSGIREGTTAEHPVGVVGQSAGGVASRLSERADERAAGRKYRLPTEAEWEFACRAGTTTPYHFGADRTALDGYDWFANNSHGEPQPVALKKPNPWGLFDMHGNRREWCSDLYASYPSEAVTDPLVDAGVPMSGSSSCRVVRGGSYVTPASQCRSAWRFRSDTRTLYHEGFGIRLALSIEALPAAEPPGKPSTADSSR